MSSIDRIDLNAAEAVKAAATLAGLSRHRTRLLRELGEARGTQRLASVPRLETELRDVEHQMTVLIGIDRRAGPFEPRLRLPDSAPG